MAAGSVAWGRPSRRAQSFEARAPSGARAPQDDVRAPQDEVHRCIDMIRTSQTQYQMLRICAFQNRAFFARNVTGITNARAQPCKQWGRDGFHLSGRDIMSDGPSFIESIP